MYKSCFSFHSPEQATKLKICLNFIDEQEKRISELDKEFRLAEPYASVLKFMRTVPGFSKEPLTAIRLLSEMSQSQILCKREIVQ